MGFKKGQSGNPGGRSTEKPWREAIMRAVKRADGKTKRLDALADAVVKAGLAGDMQAAREIGDRLDGKPAQAIVGDSESDPINVLHKIERVIVDPENRDSEGVQAPT